MVDCVRSSLSLCHFLCSLMFGQCVHLFNSTVTRSQNFAVASFVCAFGAPSFRLIASCLVLWPFFMSLGTCACSWRSSFLPVPFVQPLRVISAPLILAHGGLCSSAFCVPVTYFGVDHSVRAVHVILVCAYGFFRYVIRAL